MCKRRHKADDVNISHIRRPRRLSALQDSPGFFVIDLLRVRYRWVIRASFFLFYPSSSRFLGYLEDIWDFSLCFSLSLSLSLSLFLLRFFKILQRCLIPTRAPTSGRLGGGQAPATALPSKIWRNLWIIASRLNKFGPENAFVISPSSAFQTEKRKWIHNNKNTTTTNNNNNKRDEERKRERERERDGEEKKITNE